MPPQDLWLPPHTCLSRPGPASYRLELGLLICLHSVSIVCSNHGSNTSDASHRLYFWSNGVKVHILCRKYSEAKVNVVRNIKTKSKYTFSQKILKQSSITSLNYTTAIVSSAWCFLWIFISAAWCWASKTLHRSERDCWWAVCDGCVADLLRLARSVVHTVSVSALCLLLSCYLKFLGWLLYFLKQKEPINSTKSLRNKVVHLLILQ